jgi:hypothetical protein
MIVGVAVRTPSGEVFSLPKPARHCHLWEAHNVEARIHGWEIPWTGFDADIVNSGVQGFVDETGKFYTRVEAAREVVRLGQELAPRNRFRPDMLFSEDVW